MTHDDIGQRLAQIAEEAGRLILPLWSAGVEVSRKADDSPVTEADRRAERLILDRLEAAFPGVPVVSEEDASEFGTPEAIGPRFFLVDPLDGTKAFVRKDPNFTVNIALVEEGRPVAGAVVAPASGETWFTRGAGAAKIATPGAEPRAIEVRSGGDDPLVLISHTMKLQDLAELKSRYRFERTQAMDSSIKLVRIAEGAADLYPRHGPTMEWDIAAGHAVLRAAGGRLTGLDGEPFVYGKADEGFRNGWFVARGG
ncbi:MAG TPA: 3'(2'),5'-bisphosphate nucleotidase CysQ [Caulobacteraceae bacterium]|jgi:3'(2'), 5'-bisphosphate nucleotidase